MNQEEFKSIYSAFKSGDLSLNSDLALGLVDWAEYNKVKKESLLKKKLTLKEMKEDTEVFFRILRNRYSGFEYFNLDHLERELKFKILSSLKVKMDNRSFMRILYDVTSPYINDGNLSFLSYRNYLNYYKGKIAFLTDVLLEEDYGELRVIKGSGFLKENDRVCFSDVASLLLPTLPNKLNKKARFLLGIYSDTPVKHLKVLNHKLKVHRTTLDNITHDLIGSGFSTSNMLYLAMHSFNLNLQKRQSFDRLGFNARFKKYIVLNFLNNSGGNLEFIFAFLKGLTGFDFRFLEAKIVNLSGFKYAFNTSFYKRIENIPLILILVNKGVANECEQTLELLRSFLGVRIIGGASMGNVNFKNVDAYRLPHSKILFNVPKTKVYTLIKQGVGIIPDYWVDDKEIVKTVFNWLGEEKI